MLQITGFRSQFLQALPNATTTGSFIDSCYAHCQSGHYRLWAEADSPIVDNTVGLLIPITHCPLDMNDLG